MKNKPQDRRTGGLFGWLKPKMRASGYGDAGASTYKRALKGFNARSVSPIEDIDWHNQKLRERARMLTMSTPIAKSAIVTNRTNVIGLGLQFKSKINAEKLGMTTEQAAEWQRNTEREFALWAENKRACDAIGVNDFYELQQLAFTSWLTSGDVFVALKHTPSNDALHPYTLRLQLIEADRVRTPSNMIVSGNTTGQTPDGKRKIYDGVEVDDNGKAVAYYIHSTYPNQTALIAPDNSVRVDAYGDKTGLPQILHIMESERPDQYRGVTYLAPIIEQILQLRRYTSSELTAAIIESRYTGWVKTTSNPSEYPFNAVGPGDPWVVDANDPGSQSPPPAPSTPNEYSLGEGQINVMAPGEDIIFSDPKRPTSGFKTFADAIAVQAGAGIEVPRDLLLKQFDASYSASRAALLEAWKPFQMRRRWFVSDFCKPIYEVWLTEAIALGRISAPGFFMDPAIRAAYLGSIWIGPAPGMLDPIKEITAERLSIESGFTTREQSTIKLNGGQFFDNVAELEIERKRMIEAGLIKEENT